MLINFESQNLKLNVATGEQCKKAFSHKEGLPPEMVPIYATLQGVVDKKQIDRGATMFWQFLLPQAEAPEQMLSQNIADIVDRAKKDGMSRNELTSLLSTALEFCYGESE